MSWQQDSHWLEVSVVSLLTAVGNIFFGHFEEGHSPWRRVLKFGVMLALVITLSATLGRAWAAGFIAVMLLFVPYVHAVWLQGKGINGWTGEPKEK